MSGGGRSPFMDGIKKAHDDMVSWCYKPHGKVADEQLKKLDEAQVKREHVAYGFIGLICLYLVSGEQAFFVSVFITLTYPMYLSVQAARAKNTEVAHRLIFYWIPFGFFALIDATAISEVPMYYLIKTALLLSLLLPLTNAMVLFDKVTEPAAKAIESFVEKINSST
uniref:Receptor expression-enhancing protein n=1 Tax=Haemonchus contortus TaxID=6289 RepID=A0A7I4YU50_HAECO|nr:TB2 DP1 and HVA22 related protein domain containing protein [Haemonchus contortus]